jgi:hypothetical protein
MKMYEHYRDVFFRGNAFKFSEYKKLLSREDRYIVSLLFEIEAYHAGFTMQIWNDFRKINLELKKNQTLADFIKDEGNYRKKDIGDMAKKVDSYFKSSFENANSEKLKALMFDRELMFIKPKNEGAVALETDFQENWIKEYRDKRNRIASGISNKYQLGGCDHLFLRVFNMVLRLANNPSLIEEAFTKSLVRLLEQGIEIYLPIFYRDLEISTVNPSLIELRKQFTKKHNTLCWKCGKPLLKINKSHYCTRFECRNCYIARNKDLRDPGLPSVILRTKNKCDRCKRYSSLNYIHKLGGVWRQFCSNRCWETFRKACYRKNKLASTSNVLSQKSVAI